MCAEYEVQGVSELREKNSTVVEHALKVDPPLLNTYKSFHCPPASEGSQTSDIFDLLSNFK